MTRAEQRPRAGRVAVRLAAVAAVAALGLCCVLVVAVRPWHHWFDLRVYRESIRWWLDGHPLYAFPGVHGRYGFTYPPFAAVVLMPLALVGRRTAEALQLGLSAAVVLVAVVALVRPVARRAGWTPWSAVALAVPVAVVASPVRDTLSWGQVNLYVLGLVLLDLAALRAGRRWAGVGIGLAAAVKLTPALFVLHLVVTRRWRAAAVATGTAAAATLLGAVVAPHASADYWSSVLWDTSRVGRTANPANQSVLGVLARWAAPEQPSRVLWALLALLVLAVALTRAARAGRQGDDLVGLTLTGLAASLVSPISWLHHLVWVVPAGIVLLDLAAGTPAATGPRARPRTTRLAAGVGLAVLVAVYWPGLVTVVSAHCGETVCGTLPGALGQNSYALTVLALVLLLPARALGPDRQPPRSGGDVPQRERQRDLDLPDRLLDHE
ncbi:glycosyltransferase 87 family protein [Modestobacter sp. NPDC049651]|uniref:glycosyltransferase 87 family protein n=1 Tax=unclassified Modestobacter TaxID=2643866 RepID=UPI0034097357